MRHEHLRVLLEVGGDDDDRHVARDRVEGEQKIAAHVEVEPAGGQQEFVIGLRATLNDRDIEAVFGVGPVSDRLVISAVFGLREPVGPERNFVGGESGGSEQGNPDQQTCAKKFHSSLRSEVALIDISITDACNLGAMMSPAPGQDKGAGRLIGRTGRRPFAKCAD